MEYAENYARNKQLTSVRLDTFSKSNLFPVRSSISCSSALKTLFSKNSF